MKVIGIGYEKMYTHRLAIFDFSAVHGEVSSTFEGAAEVCVVAPCRNFVQVVSESFGDSENGTRICDLKHAPLDLPQVSIPPHQRAIETYDLQQLWINVLPDLNFTSVRSIDFNEFSSPVCSRLGTRPSMLNGNLSTLLELTVLSDYPQKTAFLAGLCGVIEMESKAVEEARQAEQARQLHAERSERAKREPAVSEVAQLAKLDQEIENARIEKINDVLKKW